MKFLTNDSFLIFISLTIFLITVQLRKRLGNPLINPVFLTSITIIGYLYYNQIPFTQYHQAAQFIDFWLQPTVVCFAIPLYLHWDTIKKQWLPILLSQLLGSCVGIISGILIASIMGASQGTVISIAAKSVTTPIALAITESMHGISAITATTVIMAGMIGQIIGFKILQISYIKMPSAKGLAIGTASHAMGLSTTMEYSKKMAAYATIGIIFNGILTAILIPILLPLFITL